MPGLNSSSYLAFPFTVTARGPQTSDRAQHVREQIEQVLFTSPRERVFRPEFGVGVRRLVFEPNNQALRNSTVQQLLASFVAPVEGLDLGGRDQMHQHAGPIVVPAPVERVALDTQPGQRHDPFFVSRRVSRTMQESCPGASGSVPYHW